MKKSLQQIWNELPLKSDKADIHSYLPIYEEILTPYREAAKNLLEIGIFKGASLLMWEQYFSGNVYGIDCSEQPHGGMADLRPLIAEGTHNIIIADATNALEVHKHLRGVVFDVIIDDGSHDTNAQLISYEIFSKYLSDTGIYIIEDIQHLDEERKLFENIDPTKNVTILDRRKLLQRYDDIMVIIQ